MTDRVKNQPGPSTIVSNPRLWPASFVKPEKQTNVCIRSYIFSDSNKVQKLLDFLKEKFPDRKVDVKQLDNGKVSVSLTSGSQSASNDDGCASFPTRRVPVFPGYGYKTNRVDFNDGSCFWFSNWANPIATKYFYTSNWSGFSEKTIPWHTGNIITCNNVSTICKKFKIKKDKDD